MLYWVQCMYSVHTICMGYPYKAYMCIPIHNWYSQMNMDEEHQLLTVKQPKAPSNYACLRFTVVVLTLLLIICASAIVGKTSCDTKTVGHIIHSCFVLVTYTVRTVMYIKLPPFRWGHSACQMCSAYIIIGFGHAMLFYIHRVCKIWQSA